MTPVGLHDERGAGRELLDFGLARADDGVAKMLYAEQN
jgi:hypothetical protein